MLLVPLVVALGCKDNEPPGCRIGQQANLPSTALTRSEDVALQRVGDNFVLIAINGNELRWAPLSADGMLGTETVLNLPALPVGRAVFGMTSKNTPGDQIVVAYPAQKAGSAQLEMVAVTQTAGAVASAPRSLFDLPADPRSLRISMGSSQSGQRAVLAWGIDSATDKSPQVLLLGADGVPTGEPIPLYRSQPPFPTFDCLTITPSRTDFGVGLVEPGQRTSWRGFELLDDGGRGYEVSMLLDVMPSSCPTVGATPRGYVVAYQNDTGTFFSDFDIPRSVVNSDIVAGSLRFGGAQRQPKVACVSSMGREFSLMFDRPSGPEVWRIDAFGNIKGGSLFLPSMTGSVGPAASVPGTDAVFTTYLDRANPGNPSGNSRYLVKVECPLALPAVPLDGSTDASASDAGK
jgi:hypothetical protein